MVIKDILTGNAFRVAASVFNPLSAVIAKDSGYKCGVVGGSVIAANLNLSPDYGLISMTELVNSVRSICMHTDMPILVDGDSGYGNALNTQRLIRELEFAGASAVTLEDSLLPFQYRNRHALSALDEHKDKLLAALEARKSNDFSVLARTKINASDGTPNLLKRIEAYGQIDVDGLCIFGDVKSSDLRIIRELTDKPLMLISYEAKRKDFRHYEMAGVRLLLDGHHAYEASVEGMFRSYRSLNKVEINDITAKDILEKYTKKSLVDRVVKKYMGT